MPACVDDAGKGFFRGNSPDFDVAADRQAFSHMLDFFERARS
jgi:hypothetical protein